MAILKYIPPKKEIIDHRSPEGGYYVAKCEVCQSEFYPARSNAKYCCYNCGLIAHRTAVANGTATKRKPKNPGTGKQKPGKAEKVLDYSKYSYEELKSTMEGLKETGDTAPKELMNQFQLKFREAFSGKK